MEVDFAPRSYARGYGLPDSKLINLFIEATPAGPGKFSCFPRPALQSFSNLGTAPNRGLFRQAGVFGGDLFTASLSAIYRASSSVGTITGTATDLVRSAASSTQRVFVADQKAWLYDGTFSQITDPDLPACVDVIYFAGRFLYLQAGTGRVYYSAVNDAGNIDGLAFEDAELQPDPVIGGLVIGDVMLLFGTSSVETWYATGNDDTPFQRAEGRSYARGCVSRDSIALVDNAAFWVADDRNVYRSSNVPERISTHGIEDALRDCTTLSASTAWPTVFEGHPWYILNIPGQGSYCYDVSQGDDGEWSEWHTYGRTPSAFRGRTGLAGDGVTYVGDDTTNDVWTLQKGVQTDGTSPITRLATAFVPVPSGRPRCNRIALSCARGVGNTNDPGSTPLVEMRFSDDQGKTWSRWRSAPLGVIGDYANKVVWQRLGLMRAPGRVFEFRCTDPVLTTFVSIEINGGRP